MSDIVTEICICKLPYQEHPFVHGARNGMDVWLLNNGTWTEEDGHPDAIIPVYENVVILLKEEQATSLWSVLWKRLRRIVLR